MGTALTAESSAAPSDAETTDNKLNGKTGTEMPVYRGIPSPREIDALVQFVKHASP